VRQSLKHQRIEFLTKNQDSFSQQEELFVSCPFEETQFFVPLGQAFKAQAIS